MEEGISPGSSEGEGEGKDEAMFLVLLQLQIPPCLEVPLIQLYSLAAC